MAEDIKKSIDELIKEFIKENLGEFHKKRLESLQEVSLKDIVERKNPYLFRAMNYTKAENVMDAILTAYLSSSDEGTFGNWLERLAVYVNKISFKGNKSASDGVDLEFERDGKRFFVAIKSGPNLE